MIINGIISKIIWIIDFFDFIFAEENRNKDFQIKTILKYKTANKMNFDLKIYSERLLQSRLDLGCNIIQVHEYGQ